MIIEAYISIGKIINLRDKLQARYDEFKHKQDVADSQAERHMYEVLALTKQETIFLINEMLRNKTEEQ